MFFIVKRAKRSSIERYLSSQNIPLSMTLRAFDESVLMVVCKVLSESKEAHKPEEAFARRFPGKGDKVRKSLKVLVHEGYVQKHPTGGSMTYQLTNIGRAKCRELRGRGP